MTLDQTDLTAIQNGDAIEVTVGGTECIVVRKDRFEELRRQYDDSEWSDNEHEGLAASMFDDLDVAGEIR